MVYGMESVVTKRDILFAPSPKKVKLCNETSEIVRYWPTVTMVD